MFGRRPTATSSSSPVTRSPFSSVTVTPLSSRETSTAADADVHLDAALDERFVHRRRRELLLAPEEARRRLDDRHLRAERRPRLPELDADDTAAEHDQPLGNELGNRALVVRPGIRVGEPGNRRHGGRAPCRDDDRLLRREQPPVDIDPALARKPAVAAHEADAPLVEPGQLHRVVEVVHHLVAAVEHGLHVELARHGLSRARDAARLGDRLGRAQQRLRGHTAVVGALAPDEVSFDDRHT